MNHILYDKVSKLDSLLLPFHSCKFKTEKIFDILYNPDYLQLWIETRNSDKELIGGFVPYDREKDFGSSFRISKAGKNNVGYIYIHDKIMVTAKSIIFIKKPHILVSQSISSREYRTDLSPDVIPREYQHDGAYDDLKQKFPDVSEDVLTTVLYFCTNPLPKGVQIELNVNMIDMSILNLETLSERVKLRD